jgi:hypothetical protein
MIEASSLVLASAHGQNRFLGMRDSQAVGEHHRTVHRSMGNGTGDWFPAGKPGISFNKCAFLHILVDSCLYFSPSKNENFKAFLPSSFLD